jgi:hypothetical protein
VTQASSTEFPGVVIPIDPEDVEGPNVHGWYYLTLNCIPAEQRTTDRPDQIELGMFGSRGGCVVETWFLLYAALARQIISKGAAQFTFRATVRDGRLHLTHACLFGDHRWIALIPAP